MSDCKKKGNRGNKMIDPDFKTPLLAKNVEAECAIELATAVVAQAVEDHSKAHWKATQIERCIEALKEHESILRFTHEKKWYEALMSDMRHHLNLQQGCMEEVERFLLSEDFHMYSAANGEEMLEALKRREAEYIKQKDKGGNKKSACGMIRRG